MARRFMPRHEPACGPGGVVRPFACVAGRPVGSASGRRRLVPPDRQHFFFQHQQRRRLGQGRILAPQFALQHLNALGLDRRLRAPTRGLDRLGERGFCRRAPGCHLGLVEAFTPQQRAQVAGTALAASRTTRHFSAPVHGFSVRLREGVIPSTVGACTNHRERTGCATPTSRANAVALTARGPTIRSTIRDRNAALYSLTSIPTIAPSR